MPNHPRNKYREPQTPEEIAKFEESCREDNDGTPDVIWMAKYFPPPHKKLKGEYGVITPNDPDQINQIEIDRAINQLKNVCPNTVDSDQIIDHPAAIGKLNLYAFLPLQQKIERIESLINTILDSEELASLLRRCKDPSGLRIVDSYGPDKRRVYILNGEMDSQKLHNLRNWVVTNDALFVDPDAPKKRSFFNLTAPDDQGEYPDPTDIPRPSMLAMRILMDYYCRHNGFPTGRELAELMSTAVSHEWWRRNARDERQCRRYIQFFKEQNELS